MTKQDVIGMTIEQLINTFDIKVKLGAKRGSAFVYCGRIGNLDVDGLDTAIVEGYKLQIQKLKSSIKTNMERPKGYKDYKAEQERTLGRKLSALEKELEQKGETAKEEIRKEIEELKEEYTPTRIGYRKWHNAITKRIETSKRTKEKIEKRLENFTSIANREIVDIYKSIDEEDTFIVIYDGTETGNAWTTEEFESGEIDYGYED